MSPTATVQLLLCFYAQVWLFRVNILFQKLNLRLTYSSLIMKIIYINENILSPSIADSEHFGVRRDKSNTLRIKRDSQVCASNTVRRESLPAGPHKEKRQTNKKS